MSGGGGARRLVARQSAMLTAKAAMTVLSLGMLRGLTAIDATSALPFSLPFCPYPTTDVLCECATGCGLPSGLVTPCACGSSTNCHLHFSGCTCCELNYCSAYRGATLCDCTTGCGGGSQKCACPAGTDCNAAFEHCACCQQEPAVWPTFASAAALRADPWGAYFKLVYGEVPS